MNGSTSGETAAERELTYGEKAVGLTFNPSGEPTVTTLKQLYAQIIDILSEKENRCATNSEISKMLIHAIREAQTAQMWAVKTITWTE